MTVSFNKEMCVVGTVAQRVTMQHFVSTAVMCSLLPWVGVTRFSAQEDLLYKRGNAPAEQRVQDLIGRMTKEEKVRQLDMYAGATGVMDKHTDDTHAAKDAVLELRKAEALWGELGVGSVHDLNATPEQYNTMQRWIVEHSRLGIPALFIEEALHGSDTGTVFPAPLNLAATWDTELAQETASAIAAEARAKGVAMILAPVLDLAREPRWGRVEENFGEDPYLPDFYNADPSKMHKYGDNDGKPLFPFGYGLSYTSFRYDDLAVQVPEPGSKGNVSATVKIINTGNREGTEVAQLYLREDVSSVETPDRALQGFTRVTLKPGEGKTVSFQVRQNQLAVWGMDRHWVVEPEMYTAWMGGSSEATLTAHFVLKP